MNPPELNNNKSTIPKVIFQTSPKPQPDHVVEKINSHCPGWKYIHFTDEGILDFFNQAPLEEFPKITDKFHSFSHGAHRADLFRYYYLFLNGGVFLDSDAMIETHIEAIINHFSFVSINGYQINKKLIFNGFIAATPQNEIIYAALKNLYQLNDEDLQNDYHLVCKNLSSIFNNKEWPGTKLYKEVKKKSFRVGVKTYDDKENLILTHYCYINKIPDFSSKPLRIMFPLICKYKPFYKLYKTLYC